MGDHEQPHDASSSGTSADEASLFDVMREAAARWGGPIVCLAAGTVMAGISWRKWAEPVTDFGHELYIPWQLAEGKVLYRDIAHLYGPLSQYFNAACFRIFGTSLNTIVGVNLCILTLMTWMIHRLFARVTDALTATSVVLVLLLMFAFSQYSTVGNYNFICPYSHEATHGTALAVGMIACLSRAARARGAGSALAAGLLLGGTALTRAEVSLAALCAAVVWLASHAVRRTSRPTALGAKAVALVAGFVVPLAAAFAFFCIWMGPADSFRAAFGAWTVLLDSAVASSAFHRSGMGLDDPSGNGLIAIRMFGGWVAAAAVAAGSERVARVFSIRVRWTLSALAGLLLFAVLQWNNRLVPWELVPRALPAAMIASWVGFALVLMRRRADSEAAERLSTLLTWCTLSGVLLAKMVLKAQVFHYGFYLAMPAVVTLVAVMTWGIPRALDSSPSRAPLFRCLALAAITTCVLVHVRTSAALFAAKSHVLDRGGDTLLVFPPTRFAEGAMLAGALSWIEQNTPPDATLAALPEGVMLNYLSRRTNPTPYINVMMVEILAYGEETILASLKSGRPDYIVLLHKDTTEFGVSLFGADPRYGANIRDWIRMEYADAKLIGAEPLQQKDRFGIKILRRR